MLLSLAGHLALLLVLIHRAAPTFVNPSDVDLGIPHSSGSLSVVYLAPVGPEQKASSVEQPKLALRAKLAPSNTLCRCRLTVNVFQKVRPLVIHQIRSDDCRMLAVAFFHQLEKDVRLLGFQVHIT